MKQKCQSESSSKIVDDMLRELNQLQQEFRNWLALDKPIIEYDAANCSFSFHLHAKTGMVFSEEFCAIFDVWRNGHESTGIEPSIRVGVNQRHSLRESNTRIEQFVLIPIPEFMQDIQPVGQEVWPKRLRCLNDCGRSRVDALNHGDALAVKIPIWDTRFNFEHWETGSSVSLRNRNHLPNGMFKRGARVVYDFTGDDGIMDEEVMRNESIQDQIVGLRLVLEKEAVCVTFGAGLKLDIELFEMVISPVKLSSGTFQRIILHDV